MTKKIYLVKKEELRSLADSIAEEFSTFVIYSAGSYCIKGYEMYRCVSDNTVGEWNENNWEKVHIVNEMKYQINKNKSVTKSTTLLSSDWTGAEAPYTIRVNLEEATETNTIDINPPSNLHELSDVREAMCNACIDGGKQGIGWFELVANKEKPTIDLPVILNVRGD